MFILFPDRDLHYYNLNLLESNVYLKIMLEWNDLARHR